MLILAGNRFFVKKIELLFAVFTQNTVILFERRIDTSSFNNPKGP